MKIGTQILNMMCTLGLATVKEVADLLLGHINGHGDERDKSQEKAKTKESE